MEIKTLDDRLREKTRSEFEKKMQHWKMESMRTLGLEHADNIKENLGLTNSNQYVPVVLDALIQKAREKNLPRLEQAAIDDFLRQFNELHNRIEENEDF